MKSCNTLFLSHGGGPLPLLSDPQHLEMVNCLNNIAKKIPKPSAIIVISAHWEEDIPTITSGSAPDLIYDYYGFPEASYNIKYPCKGNPTLATHIHNALKKEGIQSKLDAQRGFDHGLFIPLKIMYPLADIPCVQISLMSHLNPDKHIHIGHVLQQIDTDNLLIIGSGSSFHNMNAFFSPEDDESNNKNIDFENWLLETIGNTELTENERRLRLSNWKKSPSATYCHPREEHLLPLHVCYGVTQTACKESFSINILGKKMSLYLW
jgi:4,5-DOPA dioxygenase extradiol